MLVFGSGKPNQIEVRYLSLDVDIRVGDELVSSGIGGYYPGGFNDRRITAIEANSAQVFVRAIAEPSAHPRPTSSFLVLLHSPPVEDGETEQLVVRGLKGWSSKHLRAPKSAAASESATLKCSKLHI